MLVGDGSTRTDIERQVETRGLPIRCVGSVPHTSMPDVLAAMDAAVVPLRSEVRFHYSPLKLREYSAAGLPVIAPDVDDSRRLFGREAALLYPPGDTATFAESIWRLVNDEELRFTLSRAVSTRHAEAGETGHEVDHMLIALESLEAQ